MLRNVSVLLVSGVLALGGMSPALAQSRFPEKAAVPARSVATMNEGQLAPGGAAGVKEAQAASRLWNYAPFALVSGLAALVVLLTGNDDEDNAVTTTGTN